MGLSLLPLIVSAWYSKLKGGILFGFILFPLNTVLAFISGGDWTVMFRGGVPGSLSLILSAAMVGKMSELSDKLKRSNDELQKKQEIIVKKENLRINAEQDKEIFFENVAQSVGHYLRLPLSAIGSAADGVTRAAYNEENHGMVQLIQNNLSWADRMIWNLWDFGVGEELLKSEIHLKTILENVFSMLVVPKGVTVRTSFEDGLKFNVDADRFTRVIYGLLQNAIQAFRDGMEITISADTHEDLAMIMVMDSGKGISAKNKERVFEPFFTTRTRSLGLGLSIAKKVIEAHGGSIHIQSETLVGTTVTLKIPISAGGIMDIGYRTQSVQSANLEGQDSRYKVVDSFTELNG